MDYRRVDCSMTTGRTQRPLTWAEIGLRSREISVLRNCLHALSLVPGGHYLTSGRQQTAAAERLVERGMLSMAVDQPVPIMRDCVVVFLTDKNWQAVRRHALKQARKDK